ncbi:MAG: hypothetical protein VXY83_02405 [Pseudomonadota bacterium]|nr:hypothetical protein [Pseudomonadota bacterium]MEC8467185.1 hypothetical protein [Pseudomonadota bacterium]
MSQKPSYRNNSSSNQSRFNNLILGLWVFTYKIMAMYVFLPAQLALAGGAFIISPGLTALLALASGFYAYKLGKPLWQDYDGDDPTPYWLAPVVHALWIICIFAVYVLSGLTDIDVNIRAMTALLTILTLGFRFWKPIGESARKLFAKFNAL